ncbi:hypothetical protein HN011_007150 [Eciton burchellii]|nr:hypothetical protein HN011_007150 [Eciton burchellii]
MENNFYQETAAQINKAQIELQIRLEQVSKLKIECTKLQLELLKLYRPRCLEILETLRDASASADPADRDDDKDDGGSSDGPPRDNEINDGHLC